MMLNIAYTENILRRDGTEFTVNIVRPPAASVQLVSSMRDPAQLVAKVTDTYNGILTNEQRSDFDINASIENMKKTKLKTPLEMLEYVFLITNVTRAFTHQLVRYRIGTSYAQESMRFLGQKSVYNILGTGEMLHGDNLDSYAQTGISCIMLYEDAVQQGAASQDARGMLPTNIMTSIFFGANLLTLQNIFNQRICCQAQNPEWSPFLFKMRKLIEADCPELTGLITAPVERNQPCGYNATFDRPCKWKNGITADAEEGL